MKKPQFTSLLDKLQRSTPRSSRAGTRRSHVVQWRLQSIHHPVLTANHVPLEWRYDLNPETNPFCQERLGINAAFNAGPSSGKAGCCSVCASRAGIARASLPWQRSRNGIDGFASGMNPASSRDGQSRYECL